MLGKVKREQLSEHLPILMTHNDGDPKNEMGFSQKSKPESFLSQK